MKRFLIVLAALILGCHPTPSAHGVIVQMWQDGGDSTTTLLLVGKVLVPITTDNPKAWHAKVRNDDGQIWDYTIQEDEYNKLKLGDRYESDRS